MNAEAEIEQLKETIAHLEGRIAALERGPAKPQRFTETQVATIRSAPAPQFQQRKLHTNDGAPKISISESPITITRETPSGVEEI